MARPTKLNKKVMELARLYVEEFCPKHLEAVDELPSIESFAWYIDVSRSSIYSWQSDYKSAEKPTPLQIEFLDILDRIETFQGRILINHGLKGIYNAPLSKMMLSHHGYREKTEVEQTHRGDVSFINTVPRPPKDDTGSDTGL
jgi:hypothetical protein